MPVPTTRDFSVKFGRDPSLGLEGQKAFPFIYTFVNHNDDPWYPGKTVTLGTKTAPSLESIGVTIAGSSKKNHYVLLDPDYNFKLIAIRYEAYYWREELMLANAYLTYNLVNVTAGVGGLSDGVPQDMDKVGQPFRNYIDMTVSFQGSGSTILYGGVDTSPLATTRYAPLPIASIHGYDSGIYTVRTPYLLPREGVLSFEITNNYTDYLTVAAIIYGMKIRM